MKNKELLKKTRDLNKRIKELNGIYTISKIIERQDLTLEEVLKKVVDHLPSCWQYPEIACARIVLDNQEFKNKGFRETPWKQNCEIIVNKDLIDFLEICYIEKRENRDEGPFLKEERYMIRAVAKRLEKHIKRRQVEKELMKYQDHLEELIKNRTHELEKKEEHLEEVNTALKVLLKQREEDKRELEESILVNVKELIDPYVIRLKNSHLDSTQKMLLDIIDSYFISA